MHLLLLLAPEEVFELALLYFVEVVEDLVLVWVEVELLGVEEGICIGGGGGPADLGELGLGGVVLGGGELAELHGVGVYF